MRSVTSNTRTYSLLGVHEVQTWHGTKAKPCYTTSIQPVGGQEPTTALRRKAHFGDNKVEVLEGIIRDQMLTSENLENLSQQVELQGAWELCHRRDFRGGLKKSRQKQKALASTGRVVQNASVYAC